MGSLDFSGRVVLVTGAAGSLGRDYALEFARRGASVIVNDLGSSERGVDSSCSPADQVVEQIKRIGADALANYDDVLHGHRIIDAAITQFGRIDVVINNAGILRDRSFQNMTDSDWDSVFNTHVKGAFAISKAAWPYFKKQNYGRIIFTSSNSAIYGNFGQANYAAAKSALIGLSNTLSIEGLKYNIHSNVVIPTASSRLTVNLLPAEELTALKPEYVTPLVVYLGHELCQETGKVFEAAAGWYGQIQAYRSKGLVLSTPDAESIAANWDAITNMTSAKHFESIQEVTADLLNCSEKVIEGIKTVSNGEQKSEYTDKYMAFFEAIAERLNKKINPDLKAKAAITFTLTRGMDILLRSTFVHHRSANIASQESGLYRVALIMDVDLVEQILRGQVVTKEVSELGKLKVGGAENEDVIECLNQQVNLLSKL